jgi:hypothetical protein
MTPPCTGGRMSKAAALKGGLTANVVFFGVAVSARASQSDLVANTAIDGPVLMFDWPAIEICIGSYEEGPTGVAVIRFAERVSMRSTFVGERPGRSTPTFSGLAIALRFLMASCSPAALPTVKKQSPPSRPVSRTMACARGNGLISLWSLEPSYTISTRGCASTRYILTSGSRRRRCMRCGVFSPLAPREPAEWRCRRLLWMPRTFLPGRRLSPTRGRTNSGAAVSDSTEPSERSRTHW